MTPLAPDQFRNAVAALRFIDRDQLVAAGFTPTDRDWNYFSSDPYGFFVSSGAVAREAITNIINERSRRMGENRALSCSFREPKGVPVGELIAGWLPYVTDRVSKIVKGQQWKGVYCLRAMRENGYFTLEIQPGYQPVTNDRIEHWFGSASHV
jgi:hypothetical protein